MTPEQYEAVCNALNRCGFKETKTYSGIKWQKSKRGSTSGPILTVNGTEYELSAVLGEGTFGKLSTVKFNLFIYYLPWPGLVYWGTPVGSGLQLGGDQKTEPEPVAIKMCKTPDGVKRKHGLKLNAESDTLRLINNSGMYAKIGGSMSFGIDFEFSPVSRLFGTTAHLRSNNGG